MKKFSIYFSLLTILALAGAGCASEPKTNSNESAAAPVINISGAEIPVTDIQYNLVQNSAEVEMKNFSFNPASVTVKKGGKVTWTNRDSAKHDVTGDGWQSELFGKDGSFSKIFDAAGTFDYHCTPHPNMTGKIIVIE